VAPVPLSEAAAALGLGRHELVSFVGGGGKTTLLFTLGHQVDGSVVLTTTTKMGTDRTGGWPVVWSPSDEELVGRRVLAWQRADGSKVIGFDPDTVDRWFDLVDHVFVEADGSRGRPAKAPAPHEPVVPSRSTLVVCVIGADALDRVIEDQCHRPGRVAALAGCREYERLTPERAARVVQHADGGRKRVPPTARFAVAMTKVSPIDLDLVDAFAAHLDVPFVPILHT